MTEETTRKTVEAVWRTESARLIGGVVRMVCDVGLAEHLAQEALVTALEARRLYARFEVHYTPKHASWLNIAECVQKKTSG